MNASDIKIPEAERLISNQQRLKGHETRVIFEYPADNDNLVRLYVCFAKKNDSVPIKRSEVLVFLMDTNGNKLMPTAASPGPDDNLIEASGFATTAQAVFEFDRSSGQNLLFASVQLGEESKNFQIEDSQPIIGL
jgi:hypothetical protein